MWVLKLGGSLYDSTSLGDWVEAVAALSALQVIVPGGGPFADQVRAAQHQWDFDDGYAHAMALLAMEQMGLLLCALHPRLVACNNSASVRSALADGRIAVWMPSRQVLAARAVACDWTVTSDSLALWLAHELGADGVLLVKSATLLPGRGAVAALQGDGVIDAAFDRYIAGLSCPVHLVHRERCDVLLPLLSGLPADTLVVDAAS